MYACRAGEGEEEWEGEGEEEKEELLPDRLELSLSLLLDLLAERDWRAGFFFFLLIFETEALDPPAFGGSSIFCFTLQDSCKQAFNFIDLKC